MLLQTAGDRFSPLWDAKPNCRRAAPHAVAVTGQQRGIEATWLPGAAASFSEITEGPRCMSLGGGEAITALRSTRLLPPV